MYCGSPHVISLEKAKDLLAPTGIIPHAFNQKRATHHLIQWVEDNRIEPEKKVEFPRGLYLPLWTFDVGGAIDYTAEMIQYDNDDNDIFKQQRQLESVRINDQYPVMVDDLPLPASRKLSAPLLKLIPKFDMKSVKPYDPRYLADWPAEVYDIPMADASLDARSQAYALTKRNLPHAINSMRIIHTSSANLVIDSFKLVLLPVWMAELPFDGREHLVLINGQSGDVAGDIQDKTAAPKESEGLLNFLADLLDDK